MPMNAEHILKRLNTLKSERTTIESLYNLIERYVRPHSGDFFDKDNSEDSQDWGSRRLFDSTAVVAAGQLASSIHGSLTPPLVKWLTLKFEDNDLNDEQEAKEWLEECGELVYQALIKSDFHNEMNKAYLDLVSYGMAYVLLEEDGEMSGALNFTSVPLKQSYFEEGADSQPTHFYQCLHWTSSKCVDKFGDDTPDFIKTQFDEGRVTENHERVFAVWLRHDAPDLDPGEPIAPELRRWGYSYVDVKNKKFIGNEGGYYERPIMAPRWLEASDSKFGISPSSRAMGDILTLQQLVRIILSAAEKAIDPSLMVEEAGVFGDVDMRPGGITVVRDMDSMKPLITGASFDVAQLTKTELVQSIRSAFHSDDLQLKDSPAMTATETRARMQLSARVLGPTFGYLTTHLLRPIVFRTFAILWRSGALPEAPESVVNGNAELDIEFLGSLASAQKSEGADAISSLLGQVAQLGEVFPEAIDLIDLDASIRFLAESQNLPAAVLKGEVEVQEMRDARAKAQADKAQLENDQVASNTMVNASKLQAVKQEMQQ